MANRSELECFVLGLIWQVGPVSAYTLRRVMRESPSRQWSASTGAIYPVLRRLDRDGLIHGVEKSRGRRARREYEITQAGLLELRSWVGPPLGEDVVTVAFDPLRTRARFLAVIPVEARLAWVQDALKALDAVDERVREWSAVHDRGDAFLSAMTSHAMLETQARRKWLEELRTVVEAERALTR